jgi:hypothetical protein
MQIGLFGVSVANTKDARLADHIGIAQCLGAPTGKTAGGERNRPGRNDGSLPSVGARA